ncbi:hypothetical protein CRUP_024497, partial [Coryphaenoides rupestris]
MCCCRRHRSPVALGPRLRLWLWLRPEAVAVAVASPPAGAPKSKLHTLSKDDLIKFAKKQMACMQNMKTRCADLEKEVETIKQSKASSSSNAVDSNLLQELAERMEALLLEKAESQKMLVLSCKDLERTKQQRKDDLDQLQGQLVSQ